MLVAVDRSSGGRDPCVSLSEFLPGVGPVMFGGVVAFGAVVRLVALVIALRGTSPSERPAIISAMAEFFRVLPKRR